MTAPPRLRAQRRSLEQRSGSGPMRARAVLAPAALVILLASGTARAQPAPDPPAALPPPDGAAPTGAPATTRPARSPVPSPAPSPAPAEAASGGAPIEVVVRAPRTPFDGPRDATTARYTLRADDLDSPGATLAGVLGQAPGVQVSRAGGSADLASLSLRGSGSGQLPVYLGGVRLDDELTGSLDLSTLPVWLLQRVELHRGHAPRQADRLGLGGALLLVPRLLQRSGAAAQLGSGSFGLRSLQLSGGVGDPRASALAAVRYRRGLGNFAFLDDRGTLFEPGDDVGRRRRNADHQQVDAWTSGRLALPGGQLTLLGHGFWREQGVPGVQLAGTRRARSEALRFVAAASAELRCGDDRRCRLLLDSGLLASRYRLDDPLREAGLALRTVTRGQRFSQRLRVALSPHPRLSLWLGAGLQGGTLQQQVDQHPSRRARRVVLRPELALSAEPLDGLQLSAVAAINCHTTGADAASTAAAAAGAGRRTCGVLAPVGRAGVRYQPLQGLSLFANAGRYVRVPTLGELYGVTATVRGNDALAPERGVTVDAGASVAQRLGAASGYLQLVGFARWADDLIAYRRSSLGAVTPYNAQRARVLGLEVVAGGWLWRTLRLRSSLAWMDPRDTSEDALASDLLPLRARLVAHGGLTLRSPGYAAIGLAYAEAGLQYQHRARRVADPAGLIALPAQHLLDLEVALKWRRPRLALRGRLANLADQRTVDLLGYPLPGRSLHSSVEARW